MITKTIKTSYLWQISGEENRFCLFTIDKAIKRKVEWGRKFIFELWDNNFGWLFIGRFDSAIMAKNELKKMSGLTVNNKFGDDLFYTEAKFTGVPYYCPEPEERILERVKWIRLQY